MDFPDDELSGGDKLWKGLPWYYSVLKHIQYMHEESNRLHTSHANRAVGDGDGWLHALCNRSAFRPRHAF